MNNYKKSSELKSLAKGQLLGKYGVLIGAMIIQSGIMLVLQLFTSMFFSAPPLFEVIISFMFTMLLTQISGIFTAGLSLMNLKTACRYPVLTQDIFWGFKNSASKMMRIQSVLTLIEMICMIPSYYFQFHYLVSPSTNMKAYIYMMLFSFIGSFVFILLSLAYSQVFYLLHDFPQYSVFQLYQTSIRIMKGNKLRLLYLELSFIPLYMLCFLTCGIGFLWVKPYMNVTEANFYLDLMANRNKER